MFEHFLHKMRLRIDKFRMIVHSKKATELNWQIKMTFKLIAKQNGFFLFTKTVTYDRHQD